MANQQREDVNQSPPAKQLPRTHVAQSTVKPAHLRTPAGVRRESVNQSPERK